MIRGLSYSFAIPVILHGPVENSKFFQSEKTHNKVHLNMTTEFLKGFNLGVSNMLCVNYIKKNKNRN